MYEQKREHMGTDEEEKQPPRAKACGGKHIIICHNEKNEYDKNNR